MKQEHPVRGKIREALAALKDELDGFEQTCHGRMGPDDIYDAAGGIILCYEDPTAYSISDLSQAIGNFLKAEQQ